MNLAFFNYVTMHYLEKGAMYGMLDYGLHNFANKTTVYSELHDMGGIDRELRHGVPVNAAAAGVPASSTALNPDSSAALAE